MIPSRLARWRNWIKLASEIRKNSTFADGRIAADKGTFIPVFRTFSDGYRVRAMTLKEVDIVQKWWSDDYIMSDDIKLAYEEFPSGPGFYIGEFKGEVVASAIRLPWGNQTYYGSYYFVDKRFRSKGFGTRLRDQVVREHLGDNILCVDAVLGTVAEMNAAKFGYVGSFITRRYEGKAKNGYKDMSHIKLVEACEIPFKNLIDYDNKCFISKDNPVRRRILHRRLQMPSTSMYAALDDSDQLLGYGLRKQAISCQPNNHHIGPLYADDVNVAKALVQKLCEEAAGERVTIDMWTPNEAAVQLYEDLGFSNVGETLRMYMNGDPKDYKDTVFAITDIDVCGF